MADVYPWQEAPKTAFAVIGDPIGHSLSPIMQTAALAELGRSETYVAVHVPAGEVSLALDHLKACGTLGVNVTLPHKLAALDWAKTHNPEGLEALAVRLGAANTLNLQTGEARNTDAPGFAACLNGLRPRRTLVLGAGGSARAIVVALEELGSEVRLFNRTRTRAEELVRELGLSSVKLLDSPDPGDCDLVVNTTSASHGSEAPDLEYGLLNSSVFIVDLSYDKMGGLTPFLKSAAASGLRVQDGKAMLVHQGALALAWWLGLGPDALEKIVMRMASSIDARLNR